MKVGRFYNILIISIIGLSTGIVYGELSPNTVFVLEGTGFTITENTINDSEINLLFLTENEIGSRTGITVENGFVSINDEDFSIIDWMGTTLREDRFIRLFGTSENFSGEEVSVSLIGRLVQSTSGGSVYGFTGTLTSGLVDHKIIYTIKISDFKIISNDSTTSSMIPEEEEKTVIHILEGSSNQGLVENYIEGYGRVSELQRIQGANPTYGSYFSADRITIEPGDSVTFVNDDITSHIILSGKENYNDRKDPFTPDGRISTGEILPGESTTLVFEESGFYRLFDPKYPWMDIVVYSFPDVGSIIIRSGDNPQN